MCYIIYKTRNVLNDKIYVGQHFTSADDGYLGSGKYLKEAIDEFGSENFVREIIDFCTSADVDEKEIHWIAELSARDDSIGYNVVIGGRGCLAGENNPFYGKTHSEKNRKLFAENAKNLHTGRKRSKETRKRISESLKGIKVPEERKERISETLSSTLKDLWKNEDYRRNVCQGRMGHKVTDDCREKISQRLKGKPKSESHKQALREAWKRRNLRSKSIT